MVINKFGILGALDVEVKVLKECLTVRPPVGHLRARRRGGAPADFRAFSKRAAERAARVISGLCRRLGGKA